MEGVENILAFWIAGILLNLTPGADTMYILGRSFAQGTRAGVVSALGIGLGGLLHTFAAAFGLSLIIAQSALAFTAIKYLGAAYLLFLGVQMIRSRNKGISGSSDQKTLKSLPSIFWSGMLTNVLNPKVALFFLAFLPQFLHPDFSGSPLPFLILGFLFVSTGTLWCILLALFSGFFSVKLRENQRFQMWLKTVAGGIFVLLGVKIAWD